MIFNTDNSLSEKTNPEMVKMTLSEIAILQTWFRTHGVHRLFSGNPQDQNYIPDNTKMLPFSILL